VEAPQGEVEEQTEPAPKEGVGDYFRKGAEVPAQLALFSDERKPEGLRYQPDFITREEEQDLISHIVGLPLSPFQFGAFEGKRRVASFGWRYNYTSHALEKAGDLPAWIAPFNDRVESFAGLPSTSIEQLLVTEYEAGAGIGWHRDKPHFGKVFGLSLGSSCKFRFRRKLPQGWERFAFEAQPRSLYLMAGQSRSVWEHSIPPVESVRYSITFRTMAPTST